MLPQSPLAWQPDVRCDDVLKHKDNSPVPSDPSGDKGQASNSRKLITNEHWPLTGHQRQPLARSSHRRAERTKNHTATSNKCLRPIYYNYKTIAAFYVHKTTQKTPKLNEYHHTEVCAICCANGDASSVSYSCKAVMREPSIALVARDLFGVTPPTTGG